jgi:hypothetical protein
MLNKLKIIMYSHIISKLTIFLFKFHLNNLARMLTDYFII